MELLLRHGVEYEVADPVSVEDLIKSIEAHARLLRKSGDLLGDLLPGLRIEPKQVSVVSLSQQSQLKEMFAFAVVMSYQKELEQEVPELIEALTGTPISDQHDTLVTVLVMLIAIYGISKAFDALFPGRSRDNLDHAREGLLSKAAALTGIAAKRILAAVEVLFTGRSNRVLVGASQKVFAPTRGQADAAIRDNSGAVLVSPEAVKDAQSASGIPFEPEDEEGPKSQSEFHRGVRVILHAMDKDHKRRGWAGHCPDLFDDRIPMHLEKALSPDSIFGKDEIRGDILLTSEEDENGDMKPKEFLLVQADL
mgnify:CR=1 FL=1